MVVPETDTEILEMWFSPVHQKKEKKRKENLSEIKGVIKCFEYYWDLTKMRLEIIHHI